MKRLIMTGLALCAAVASAMPAKKDLYKTQPLVNELMSSVVDDYNAKKKTAKEVAEIAEKFANEAEGEAAKFLLLKGAIIYYSRAAEYDKAADMVEAIKAEVKDVPPEVLSEIIFKATLRIRAKNAPRLFAQYKAARAQIKAQKEMKALEAALKKRPGNLVARREYAEALAVFGDWKKALQEFALLKDAVAAMAKAELDGKAKSVKLAEFWWSYKTQSEDVEDAIKAHAAMYYKQAIDAGELSGLKKTLAEQRIAEVGTTVVAAAVETAEDEAANEPPPGCKFITKGNEATMVFPNGVTLEFAKCPAGQFRMLYDYETRKTVLVKITRPFWFSKTYILAKHIQAAFPEKERFKNLRGGEGFFEVSPDEFENGDIGMVARLNDDFKSFFPKGYVVRLTSMAEYEYAYHANTEDRNDPFYTNNQWDLSGEQHKLMRLGGNPGDWGIANKWGIRGLGHSCWFLDRVDPAVMKNDLVEEEDKHKWSAKYRMKKYCGKPAEKDPFLWSESDKALNIRKIGHMNIPGRHLAARDKNGPYHLVIGPDLVSEWRAKNKKK